MKLIKLTLFLLLASFSFAQEIDTMTINGKEYFVYPFKNTISPNTTYYSCMKADKVDFQYDMYLESYEELFGDKLTKKQFKKLIKEYGRNNTYGGTKISKKLKKIIQKDPYPLLNPYYSFDTDIVPVLDPIPDGEYVQLFDALCIIDEKGTCSYIDTLISGYFTIKDNMLQGEAKWINLKGEVLKSGQFDGGQRIGEWRLETRTVPYSFYDEDEEFYLENGHPNIDTSIVYQEFSNGAEKGKYKLYNNSKYPIVEGHYNDGESVGEWKYRDIQYTYNGFKRKRSRNNDVVTKTFTYADQENEEVLRIPWIRSNLIRPYNYDYNEFDFYDEYSLPYLGSYFEINFPQEEDLDLDEETFNSYGSDQYNEYGEYGDYGYYDYEGMEYSSASIYDSETGEYISRSKLIDSLGLRPIYQGDYVVSYPNGQIAYKYNFDENTPMWEDTIFWSNGTPHDIIVFNADSNHYERSVYDVDSKLYQTLVYDSVGEFVYNSFEQNNDRTIEIDGLTVHVYDMYDRDGYSYYNYDTLDSDPSGEVILSRSWDSEYNRIRNVVYDKSKKSRTEEVLSYLGTLKSREEYTFGDDYTNWTSKSLNKFSNLELLTTSSGSEFDYRNYYYMDYDEEEDTIKERYIIEDPTRGFVVASDYELNFNGELYTGDVLFNFNGKKLKTNDKNLSWTFPKTSSEEWTNVLDKYIFKDKIKNEDLLGYFNNESFYSSYGEEIYYTFFWNLLKGQFDYGREFENFYEYEYGYSENYGMSIDKLVGKMVAGKPEGIWTAYDNKNNVIKTVSFTNGEINGEVKTYDFAEPEAETDYYSYNALKDSLPEEKTYYLQSIENYKSDMMDGQSTTYNWLGEVMSRMNYKDDYPHGESYQRNALAFSKSNFQNGELDGYVQTYLTQKGKDTILLYDLNFQDGQLQGESKAYHLNGQLAKRGFFLNGQSIEDYEAYDTLGFKYHYVKFEYSFPVEEKIWEENELSVRYTFDWQDSIYFQPEDITMSQSLEQLIYKLGLGGYGMYQPYYGRPTLVDKYGVDFHMTKYYPNDTIARDGDLNEGKKIGNWKFYGYEGELLYEADYADSIIEVNDSIKFKSKGILSDFDDKGNLLYKAFIIEKFEKYDCSHTDHYEIRQLCTIWEADDSLGRMNGYVKNYYDNGTLQNEGQMKDGLPTGIWKFYDPFGMLNQAGVYLMGKRDGRWLAGDLSKTKYLGDICLNPNLPDLEEEIKYRENLLDIQISNYKLGKLLNRQYYDIDMNQFVDEEETEEAIEEEEAH